MFILVFALLSPVYCYICYRIGKFGKILFPGKSVTLKITRRIYYFFVAIASLSFFLGRFLNKLFHIHSDILSIIGSIWLEIAVYLGLFAIFYHLLILVIGRKTVLSKMWLHRTVYVATMLFIFTMAIYQTRPHIDHRQELTITADTTGKSKSYKILFMSDLHLGFSTDKEKLQHFINAALSEKPDFAFLGGDLVDNDLAALVDAKMEEELRQLTEKVPTYLVWGNHDDFESDTTALLNYLNRCGIVSLLDSTVIVDSAFAVIGRRDKAQPRKSLKELRQVIPENYPVILLDHRPSETEETVNQNILLSLSGHTHNGQFFPFNFLVFFLFDNAYGHQQHQQTHFYTSSGVGKWGYGPRIGTKSEYVVIHLTVPGC